MNDRELLELAAKAAGVRGEWLFNTFRQGVLINGLYDELMESYWNPLTDDGDALRLAVKCLPFYTLQYTTEDYEHCSQDGYAATRRAIVRAAAEIGKELK